MSELTRATYFAENNCQYPLPPTPCPVYPYPLENVPACRKPCKRPSLALYGNPQPAEFDGSALGNSLFYYHDPTPYPLQALTVPPHAQPYHHGKPFNGPA